METDTVGKENKLTIDEVLENNGVDTENADIMVFRDPDYAEAVIGITLDDNVVYDYDKMIQVLVKEDHMTEEDAIDFLDYNTFRVIPYMAREGTAPVIIRQFYSFKEEEK